MHVITGALLLVLAWVLTIPVSGSTYACSAACTSHPAVAGAIAHSIAAGAPLDTVEMRVFGSVARGGGYPGYGAPPAPKPHKHKGKKRHTKPLPVHMKVSAGYSEQYRIADWIPVRVTMHNRSSSTISGTIEIPDSGNNNQGPPPVYRTLYSAVAILPAGATKNTTLFIPGSSVQGEVAVRLRSGGRIVGTGTDSPSTFTDSDLSIGALTSDPANIAWLKHVNPTGTHVSLVRLKTETVDTLPQALGNFDVIALTDGTTSHLNGDQLKALEGYVRSGGSLLLVGGPSWQETLRPLPVSLVPGHVSGSQKLPDLLGLQQVTTVSPSGARGATTVSVLSHPHGTVLATQGGVPLAVQADVGHGHVMYLAFDPSLDPILHWRAARSILTRLVAQAAPMAVSRSSLPQGMQPNNAFFTPWGPPLDISSELSNIPSAALPSIILFLVLTVAYILLLGPVNFFILGRLRRRSLAWITIPLGAILCVGATFGVAFHLKGNTVLLNSVGVVQLDGHGGPQTAALYVGLFAPVRGDYKLTYDAPALPTYVPQFNFDYSGPNGFQPSSKVGLQFAEGSQTQVQFPSMNMWSIRDVALHSTVNITGTVRGQLHLDPKGYITGAVHNDTRLTLIRPMIIAGNSVIHLKDMPPEKTMPIRIKPSLDAGDGNYSPIWIRMYGQNQFSGKFVSQGGPCFGCIFHGGMGGRQMCCFGPGLPDEKSLSDRIKNTVMRLPEAQTITSMGDVVFTAWNQQPIGPITVDGVVPQRRDLNLIMTPLSVTFPSGPFRLRSGTFAAHLVDDSPQLVQNNCCGPAPQPIYLGTGGWANFKFTLPQAHRLHFSQLGLYLSAGGADGTHIGRVYDWRAKSWVPIDLYTGYSNLKNPDRFVSPKGEILLNLRASDYSNDVKISDPHHDIQLAGMGTAG